MSAAQTAKRRRKQMRNDKRYRPRKGGAAAQHELKAAKGRKK